MAAYITEAQADALLVHRTAWAGVASVLKLQSLDQATNYLDAVYGAEYIGQILASSQALPWPRTATADNYGRAIANGEIPPPLQRATAEAAFLAATGSILLPTTVSSGGSSTSVVPAGTLTEKTVKAGPLTTTTKYSAGGTTTTTAANAVLLATDDGIPLIGLIAGEMNAIIGSAASSGTTGSNYRILRS